MLLPVEYKILFQGYQVLKPPLTRNTAKKCCKELVAEVAEALEELDKLGFAHLDVRLENVCFNDNYQAVLIDFDQVRPLEDFGLYDYYPQSCMYCFLNLEEEEETTKHLDYRQLGVMAIVLVYDIEGREYHALETLKFAKQDRFLETLVYKGERTVDVII